MAESPSNFRMSWVGDRHLRVSVGEHAAEESRRLVLAATAAVHNGQIPSVVEVVPGYSTVLVTFDLAGLDARRVEGALHSALSNLPERVTPPGDGRLIEVPVCYEMPWSPDLVEVAGLHAMNTTEVVDLHCSVEYTVRFIGFSPGFPYLDGLPERLATPRLDRPRTRVPAGSVAIGGAQAGIYPRDSPGGWRLIGRTPLELFEPRRDPPSLLAAGDRVRFSPMSKDAFDRATAARGEN